MATLDELAEALIVAEQQGDAEAVSVLAQAYQEQKAAQTPVLQDTGQGRFTSALSNVARGVTSVGPNVVGGLGYLTGSEALQEAGESMEGALNRAFPVNPLYAGEFSQKAANVIGQAGGTLATGGVGGSIGKALGGASAIGKGAQAGALIPAFLAGTRGGGQEAERYGMTGGTAYARALLGGGIELASEKFLFGLGTETAAARRLLGESLDFGKGVLLKAAGTEAGEEAAAQIGGNVATMALAPEGVETPGAFEGTLESAALGAVGGGFLGGVNALTGQPRKPVLDAEGNQVTVEGQPVFEDDLTPPEELPESVAPLTIADVQDDPVLEPVIEAASETVVENADVLPITNQVLQEINAPTETETLPGEPVPEVEAEAPAQEAPVEPTPINETAQVEIQETGGPVAVEQLATEALPEDQAQEGVEVGQGESAEVVAETPVAETPVAETPAPAPPRTPSRAATPIPQAGQTVQFRREGKPMTGTYRGRDRLGRHIVESEGREEFVASTPAVIENTPIQGVTTPETFPDKGVQLSAASMRSRGRRGLTVQETETIAQNFSKALRKGPPVRVVTAAQIANDAEFSEVRDAVGKVGGKVNQVEGWFDRRTNTVFLVADQVANARRARQVLIHEVIGHGGVMSVATPAEMRRIADIIRRVAPRIVSNVETYYKNASEAEKVREILARFSEDYTSADPANLPQGWKRAWEEIKQITRAIIKKMGGDPNAFDDLDLHRFYTNAVRAVYEEGIQPTQESDTMMSLNYPGTEEAKEEIRLQEEAEVTNARETRARFAPADKENLRYIPTTQADFIKAAEEFMDSLPLAEAAQRVLDGQVPENMRPGEDGRQHVLVAEAIRRLSVAAESTADPYEQAEYLALANQMALKFAREGTADGRALNSRATANTLLAPIAPVLAAQRIMRERITKTLDARFDGGTEAVTQRVRKVSEDAAAQASEDVAAELEDEAEVESEANDLRQRAEVEAERIISSLVHPKEYEKAEVHPVRAVYNEHMEKPMERAAFEARVISLGVDPQTAANLYSIAEQELRGRQMSEQLEQRKKTEAILAKDSPKLVELLNKLRKKMFPGTNWRTIFEDLPDQQLARQKAIYERLRKDERLRNLTTEEGVALTNELDKAWQRQRRKVFLEDLKRQGVLGEKDAADRQKVAKAYPKIIRALNLGTFNSELMREAMASEYGIRTITAQEASELRKLAQEAYQQPEGILRNKKVAEVINKLQNATGSSISELVNNYWVASVLSGTATMFDTYMSAFNGLGNNLLQAGALFARGQRGDALAAVSQWFEGLRQGARESMLILAKGDYSVLKRFGTDLNKALEGDSNFRPIPLGESLWRNGNAFQKYGMAPVMMWTGRLMSAADHINNTATSYGAMAVARALHPEIYEGKGGFTKAEKDAAREQALREVTGGAPPQTLEDKATVSKRTREILAGLLTTEQQEEANFIGDQAAYQNDPLGLFGSIYQGISAGIGTIERGAESLSTDPAVQSQFMRAILGGLAGGLRGLTGTKFMRFGFNFGNDITQYIPGTYLLQKLAPVYGTKMSRSQQELLLGKNIFGLMAAVGVAAMFLDKDDDEEGWHIEGNWSGLNNDFKNQLRSQGKEPNTFWRRRPDGSIQRISYRSWPTSGIMVAVGSMNDQKRYQPAKWQETGLAAHLLRAVGNGALQVKDTTALSGLSELLGVSSYSTDPEKSAMERLAKTAFKFEGGFFPSLLKDIDSWEDPNNYRPETLLGEMVRHVPLARRSASDGRPMLNLLGEPVELSRVPWRRVYTESKEGPEYTVLGQLLSRGLSLPEPSSKRTVKVDGQTTTIEQMGPRAEWEFARILGEKYREFLLREGPTLERLDNDRAEKRIRKRAQDLGDQAENEMVRLLKANP